MDVKAAFFNGELDEQIHIDQQIGCESKVYSLKRSIFGLKQLSINGISNFNVS